MERPTCPVCHKNPVRSKGYTDKGDPRFAAACSQCIRNIKSTDVNYRLSGNKLEPVEMEAPGFPVTRPDTISSIECINGDCVEVMGLHLPPKRYSLIVTDLPYGITGSPTDFNNMKVDLFHWWRAVDKVLADKGTVVMTTVMPFTLEVMNSNPKWLKYELIWQKDRISKWMLANRRPVSNYEIILVFSKGSLYSMTYNDTGARTILKFNGEKDRVHPTQKPVTLFEWLVRTYSNEGEWVLDTCAGSGTTGVACYRSGRHATLIEKYGPMYEIMKRRMETECVTPV